MMLFPPCNPIKAPGEAEGDGDQKSAGELFGKPKPLRREIVQKHGFIEKGSNKLNCTTI